MRSVFNNVSIVNANLVFNVSIIVTNFIKLSEGSFPSVAGQASRKVPPDNGLKTGDCQLVTISPYRNHG